MKKCIMVPYDFSNEADFALEHAYEFARPTNLPIHLIHVVSSEKDLQEWEIELKKVAKKFSVENNTNIVTVVRAGNLFDTIYEYGLESNAYLAVMGTHGIKTIDKAMKLIKQFVKIPFVLVQRPINFGKFDKICVPIDDNKKSRAKFLWVKHLEELFKSKVYVVYVDSSDSAKRNEINKNLRFATTIFEEYAIDFDVHPINEQNAYDDLYDYMYDLEPDVVLFMTDKYKKIVTNLKKAQNIELAKKIPVMCVNPRTDIIKVGGFSY
ncbi:MAG: universal stress protein [Bacteroidales bacterium]|nr:universal stress protein [Bacteroidales bacterium]